MRSKGGDNGQHKINPILVIYHYFLGLQWKILTLLSNLPIIIIIINIIIDWQLLVFMPSVYGSLGNDNIMDILHMLQSWFCRCFDTARACHYRNMAMFYSLYSKTGMYYFSACISFHFMWCLLDGFHNSYPLRASASQGLELLNGCGNNKNIDWWLQLFETF